MQKCKEKLSKGIPLIMGILNVTPDSFFDGGRYNSEDTIKKRVEALINEGADIIDIGGESSRPNSEPVDEEEELSRIIPAIKITRKISNIPISIDTYKSGVARASINEGATIINDIYGLRKPKMFDTIADLNCPVIIMHMHGQPDTMQENPLKFDEKHVVINFLKEQITKAMEHGISQNNIFVDPGIGFGKEQELNLRLIKELEDLNSLGYPVVLGVSRKSLVGKILDVPADERMLGSTLLHMIGAINGATIIRTHDVKETSQMIKILMAIKQNTIEPILN